MGANDKVLNLAKRDGSTVRVWMPYDAETMIQVLWLERHGAELGDLDDDGIEALRFAMRPIISRFVNRG